MHEGSHLVEVNWMLGLKKDLMFLYLNLDMFGFDLDSASAPLRRGLDSILASPGLDNGGLDYIPI